MINNGMAKPEWMDEYLKATKLCDCDDGAIKNKAQEIIKDATTPKEAATKIFYFVRDKMFLYPWGDTTILG